MHREPTHSVFEIVFDEDQTRLGGLPIFGFAVRLSHVCDGYQAPDDFAELAAMGHEAIVAFLDHAGTLLLEEDNSEL
jgi:hypothetical protein